jgi:hypothetical protein
MLEKIKEIWKRPVPGLEFSKERYRMALYYGLLIFAFLFVFKPFGIDGDLQTIFMTSFGFGLVTSVTIIINSFLIPIIIPRYINPDHWTFGKTIVINMYFFTTIAFGNWLYDYFLLPNHQHDFTFFEYLYITVVVGIMPSIIIAYIIERRQRSKNDLLVTEMNLSIEESKHIPRKKLLTFSGAGSDEELQVEARDFLLAKSEGNYCELHYLEAGMQKSQLIRITLKQVEEIVQNQRNIFRIHRSYIINLSHINELSGNARNLVAHLNKYNLEAPISRTYQREVTSAIRHNL